jgi:plastocyanin
VAVVTVAAALAMTGIVGVAASAGGHRLRGHDREVEIQNFTYRPGKTTVARGTKVVFSNRDSTTHTATSKGAFDTGRIRPGRSATVTLRKAGVYRFHCTIHPFMHGKIVVK